MRIHRITLLAIAAAMLGACVGGPNDRCYIEDIKYREARRAFERTQSTQLTRQAMEDADWPNCEINEAIYRIEKEFGLHDTLPSPVKIRSEEELNAEELQDREQLAADRGSFLDFAR